MGDNLKKVINIILLIIWMIIIFMLSNDKGVASSSKSDGIASFISNIISFIDTDTLIFIIRKLAHITEYFILGILLLNVLKDYNDIDTKLIIITILFCFSYAISDEVHQLFIQNRSGKFTDVLIDTLGSSIGVIIYYLYLKKKFINGN